MNDWKLYLIGYKIQGDDGQWKWHRTSSGVRSAEPLLGGKLSFEVKDQTGAKVGITLIECETAGVSTKPDSVRVPLVVTLQFEGLSIPLGGGGKALPMRGHHLLPDIHYDLTGRNWVDWPKPEKK